MNIQEEIEKEIKDNELYKLAEWLPEDWQQAFDKYLPLATAGDAKAQFNVAYCYAKGDIMDQNYALAFEWYKKSAANGDPRAHYNMSLMYERGEFVTPDSVKATELLNRAIELGDVRPKLKVALANAKEALKNGERDKARSLFAMIASSNKEAEFGIIACDAIFNSRYKIKINYSYHASGSQNNRKHWKWADSTATNIEICMTNNSIQSWHGLVKALCRTSDGIFINSNIEGVLRPKETTCNTINPEDFGDATLCGVEVFSDVEGSADKPSYKFYFPGIPIKPDETETLSLQSKLSQARVEMSNHNKDAKPKGCFVLTACYGSYDAPTVIAFRSFRDQHLAQSKLGRNFISWYYTHGPKWAEVINDKPRVKAVFRAVFNQLAKVLPR